MAIDPSIPLSINQPQMPPGVDIGADAQRANALMALQRQAQGLKAINTLTQIFKDPSSLDASGNPTPNALREVMAADPETGLKLRNNMLVQQQNQMKTEIYRTTEFQQKIELSSDVNDKALVTYEDGIRNGLSEPAARQRAQQVYSGGVESLKSSGVFSEQEQARFPSQFNPMVARSNAMTFKDWLQYSKQQRDEARSDEKLDLERRKVDQGTPALAAERDADTVAAANIAAKEQSIGRPLTDAEKAQMRQDARIQPKVEEAQRKGEGDPASVDQTAKMIANYQMQPLTAFALRTPWGEKVMARVGEINPDYQAGRYAEVNRAMTSFSSGKQGDTIRALNVATQHLDVMQQAADALKNGDMRAFNSVANTISREFGVAAPTTFDGVKQIVGTEIEKAVAGGIGAVADRDRLMSALATANSPQQLAGVFGSFKQLMAGQLKGLKQQYEDATGFKEGPYSFDNKLLPETKRQLGAVEAEANRTLPRITDDQAGKEAFAKLKKGEQFIGPDGKTWTKN